MAQTTMKGRDRTKTDKYSRAPRVSYEQGDALPHGSLLCCSRVSYRATRIYGGLIREVVCSVREVSVETGQFVEESKTSVCLCI